MKKILAVMTIIAALSIAGTALAYGGNWRGCGGPGYDGAGRRPEARFDAPAGPGYRHDGWHRNGAQGGRRHDAPRSFHGRGDWNIEVPQEIRDKMTEAQKLRIDLRAELAKNPVDKAKALEVFRKHRALRNEIGDWFFMQKLDAVEKRNAVPATPLRPAQPNQPTQQPGQPIQPAQPRS